MEYMVKHPLRVMLCMAMAYVALAYAGADLSWSAGGDADFMKAFNDKVKVGWCTVEGLLTGWAGKILTGVGVLGGLGAALTGFSRTWGVVGIVVGLLIQLIPVLLNSMFAGTSCS